MLVAVIGVFVAVCVSVSESIVWMYVSSCMLIFVWLFMSVAWSVCLSVCAVCMFSVHVYTACTYTMYLYI